VARVRAVDLGHRCLWQCPSPTCCMAGSLPTSCALQAIQR
jgi:hypothetical protein